MRALKTIVATAVIVFALTTVAMAGVQHLTKQSTHPADPAATQAQHVYAVTLTAAQLEQLMDAKTARAQTDAADAHGTQAQQVERVRDTVRTTARDQTREQTRDHDATRSGSASDGPNSGIGTCAPNDWDHAGDHAGDGEHHSGDTGEGCR